MNEDMINMNYGSAKDCSVAWFMKVSIYQASEVVRVCDDPGDMTVLLGGRLDDLPDTRSVSFTRITCIMRTLAVSIPRHICDYVIHASKFPTLPRFHFHAASTAESDRNPPLQPTSPASPVWKLSWQQQALLGRRELSQLPRLGPLGLFVGVAPVNTPAASVDGAICRPPPAIPSPGLDKFHGAASTYSRIFVLAPDSSKGPGPDITAGIWI